MQIDPSSYREAFFDEANEHLATLEAALLTLNTDVDDRDAISEAFRAAHSIKGAADAVGLPEIAQFTHGLETILDQLRSPQVSLDVDILDLLLDGWDVLANVVKAARNGTSLPDTTEFLTRMAEHSIDNRQPVDAESTGRQLKNVTRDVVVTIVPAPTALQAGLDPIPLLRDLAKQVAVEKVTLKAAQLPRLPELNPEQCYLAWHCEIETKLSDSALLDLFSFASEQIAITIQERVEPPQPNLRIDPTKPRETWEEIVQFSKYLIARGSITSEQALRALDFQRASRPSIGALAIEVGLMCPDEVYETLTRMENGQKFGQTAMSYRLLRQSQLDTLLQLQEERTPTFSNALLATKALSHDLLLAVTANFMALPKSTAEPKPIQPPTTSAVEDPEFELSSENAELIAEFCSENEEHLEAIDRHLLTIDENPTDAEALNAVYRGYHTLKGGASMLGLTSIKTLAHEAENLLNLARDGKVVLREKALDLTFASTDALKRQLGYLRNWLANPGELETDPTLPQLIGNLRAHVNPGAIIDPTPLVDPVPEKALPPLPGQANDTPQASRRSSGGEKETVRVDKDRLDKLINSIGELVIAQSMAEEEFNVLSLKTGGHSNALAELSKISRDIQELGLSLRMVPLQGIFQKMARLVRDLSRKVQKSVSLELHGEDTELDKTVVDQLGDPLMHMVRNAIDHGLESTEDRVLSGKPVEGKVTLRAYHQGGSVFIELSDDGKGLDRDRILKKAIEKGIVKDDQKLSEADIYALIFEPGFSTAKAVTDVSGRGVGMDVVRRNVELLQGSIHIRTVLGKGTTFTIRLPLTLAIMDGLLVALGEEVFIIPLLSVVESFRPRRQDLYTVAGKAELVSVRGETVPILRLHHLLNSTCRQLDPHQGLLVLVEDQGVKYALLIDELLGQMQAVVKSLDSNYRPIDGLAGATILGNGRVALILDVHGLVDLHRQIGYAEVPPQLATPALRNLEC